ncbi:hypothetical protein AB0B50_37885 [Streptomyces sp. NPDC041068]|uniref:NACHT domain-containing protein n=1 Tax=Streptomyces sp. NPDC041068 TaxID=3155130 RepID=UPI0033E60D8A
MGGALTTAVGAAPELLLSLVGADAQLARLSSSLVSGAAERIHGLGRFERTERLAAAHAVIVVAAYGDAVAAARLPFDERDLAETRTDSVRLATGDAPESRRLTAVADHLLRSQLPLPSPHEPYEATLAALSGFYASMSRHMEAYVSGLALWDEMAAETREEVCEALHRRIPPAALTRYEELFRQLATDFPDVGIWADRVEHRATRLTVRRLEDMVARLADGDLPAGRLAALRRAGAMPFDAPVLGAEGVAAGMSIPSLREAYISPDFRVAGFAATDPLTSEWWWREQEARHGLDAFLEGLLTAPTAVGTPILLLGLPGSGKSLLTKVLAAQLPADDFLVVRVPLRDVPADTGVQEQIEAAMRQATGERAMGWADVVRAADGALPVVLLDGFDELLQATGLHQSDYLERVADFQRREAALGRPLAIVVTSRTVVADRARLTPGGIAIRLEPFNTAQTEQWLAVWNGKNTAYFDRHGLRPLTAEQALAKTDLASQPLLLLMLALYDAEDNAFQREAGTLASYELYERLLARFARREVLKHEARLTDTEVAQSAEHELLRLSVAAFGMFNRGRQWVTEDELDADLGALLPHQAASPTELRAVLTEAQTTIGQFFFIHRAEAFRDDMRLRSYEFLHATFGEFLIARLITHELQDLLAGERAGAQRPRRSRTDDSFLYALLSFAACAGSGPVTAFLTEALRSLPPQDRDDLNRLLLPLFHDSLDQRHNSSYASYRPSTRSAPAAHACYHANLLFLVLVVAEEVTGRDLFPNERDPVTGWRRSMLLLESQLGPEQWSALANRLRLERAWDGERRSIKVGLAGESAPGLEQAFPTVDPFWTYDGVLGPPYSGWVHTSSDDVLWHAYLRCDQDADALLQVAQVLDELGIGIALTNHVVLPDGESVSAARLLLELWSKAGDFSSVHRDALRASLRSLSPEDGFAERYLSAVLRQWELTGHPVPQDWVDRARAVINTPTERGALDRLLDELPQPPARSRTSPPQAGSATP